MKISKLLAGLILVIGFSWTMKAQTDTSDLTMPVDGTLMYVANNSGLYLRQAPSPMARKLTLMNYGDSAQLIDSAQSDQIEWMDGHWVKVVYEGEVGYAFDGFLSRFPLPYFGYDAITCEDMPLLMDQYFSDLDLQGYQSHIIQKPRYTSSRYDIPSLTLSEVFHIFLQGMDYCPEKDLILDDLLFHEQDGEVIQVSGHYEDGLSIRREKDRIVVRWSTPCVPDNAYTAGP